ncbi:fungal-specific transcription factor domain-containing protein [Lipomyces starkeyi]
MASKENDSAKSYEDLAQSTLNSLGREVSLQGKMMPLAGNKEGRPFTVIPDLNPIFSLGFDLSSAAIIDHLTSLYFYHVHPCLPIFNRSTFFGSTQRSPLILIAICAISTRFSFSLPAHQTDSITRLARERIVIEAVNSTSLETLTALTILCTHSIGSGLGPQSWSIIGMMTRAAISLGLSFDRSTISRSISLIPKANTWVEKETRRRVFWAIFMLERFSCVGTGWNTTIGHLDIEQR